MKKTILCFALISLLLATVALPCFATNGENTLFFLHEGIVYEEYNVVGYDDMICGIDLNTGQLYMGAPMPSAHWINFNVHEGEYYYIKGSFYGLLQESIILAGEYYSFSAYPVDEVTQYFTYYDGGYIVYIPAGVVGIVFNLTSSDYTLYKGAPCHHMDYYFYYEPSSTPMYHDQYIHCNTCGYDSINALNEPCTLSSSSIQAYQCTVCLINWGCTHPKTTVSYIPNYNNTHCEKWTCSLCDHIVEYHDNIPCDFNDRNQCVDCLAYYNCPHTEEVILYLPITTNTHSIVSRCTQCKRDLPILEDLLCDFVDGICQCGNVEKFTFDEEPTRDIFKNCTVLCEVNYLDGTKNVVNYNYGNLIFDEMGMLDLFGCVRDSYSNDTIDSIDRVKLYIFFDNYVNLKTTRFFTDAYVYNVFYIGGVANEFSDTYQMSRNDTTLYPVDDYGNATRANVVLCEHILIEFGQYDIKNLDYNFKIGAYTETAQLVDLFTGIYDGMLNTVYHMTNFNILGFNLAGLVLGLFTLAVVVVILKKVI